MQNSLHNGASAISDKTTMMSQKGSISVSSSANDSLKFQISKNVEKAVSWKSGVAQFEPVASYVVRNFVPPLQIYWTPKYLSTLQGIWEILEEFSRFKIFI